MSLVIRRVKEISKKRNRKSRKWYILEPFDDTPSKLLIDEEYGEEQDSLPSLNSVYKKTIVGTPILFRRISGWEYQENHSYNVNFHSITFMKEYHYKSLEELRWEDYISNRKGNHYIHQETNFPRIITNYNFSISDNFEFFHPLPRNILKHLNLGRVLEQNSNEIIFSNKNKVPNIVFVGKTLESTERKSSNRYNSMPLTFCEDNSRKLDPFTSSSETNNVWHLEQAKMYKEKIKDYFGKIDALSNSGTRASPNILFFLPCRSYEASLIKLKSKRKNIKAALPSSYGDYNPVKETGNSLIIKKYSEENQFNKMYLLHRLNPYLRQKEIHKSVNYQQRTLRRCKNHLLGIQITSFYHQFQ